MTTDSSGNGSHDELAARLAESESRLAGLELRAEDLENSGKPVPDHLKEDIADQKLELDGLRADIERQQLQIRAIQERFSQDKQRYMELTELSAR